MIAVTDVGGKVVIDACDSDGRDKISVSLLYPGGRSSMEKKLAPLASLRYCVSEFKGIKVDLAGDGWRLNYSFVKYVEFVPYSAFVPIAAQPTAAEMAAKDAKLAIVASLWTISRSFNLTMGPPDIIKEVQVPVGYLTSVSCDVQPAVLCATAVATKFEGWKGRLCLQMLCWHLDLALDTHFVRRWMQTVVQHLRTWKYRHQVLASVSTTQ